jgi:sugar phosphate isomerase/epimerase
MKQMKLNRRQAMLQVGQTSAACVLGTTLATVWAQPSAAPASPAGPRKLTIGIATLGFDKLTNDALAKELAATGFHTIQLFLSQTDSKFWKYNGRADVSSLTPDRCKAIAETYRGAGLNIHSIGVYANLIHPDPAERTANLDYFEAMMEIGRNMGVRTFISEAGHYQDPKKPEPAVPQHFQDAVWPQTIATVKALAARAEKFEAKVLLEPFYRGFFASAKRTRLFLEEVNSPRIRALLDPANLIEVNDLDEMFQQLGPWIDCLHAKDRKLHTDRGVGAGQGALDYPKLVTLAARHTPHAPLILEYVGPNDYKAALAHLRGALRQAGIGEA